MGGGSWSKATYTTTNTARAAAGIDTFAYSATMDSAFDADKKVHDTLNPYKVTRESRDSDEHPNSLAIAVLLDVTGSMRGTPREIQKKLPELLGLILRKGYVEDPHILFGAIGDASPGGPWSRSGSQTDKAPLQVGQFESDNRMDTHLENIWLEGGGGGGGTESYELAMYFMARHTSIDCYDKRGKPGYLFIIGDERPYDFVSSQEVKNVIGDDISENISVDAIFEEVKKRYNVYRIHPCSASYAKDDYVTVEWKRLLGQNIVMLDDTSAIAETIALLIGMNEGVIDDLDEGLAHLDEVGSTAGKAVGKALAKVGSTGKGSVVVAESPTALAELDEDDNATRL